MIAFWLVWTPMTLAVTILAFVTLQWFFFIWLIFGYLGVIAIPYEIFSSSSPQTLKATDDALLIHDAGVPFRKNIRIARDKRIRLHFGHYDDGEGESVVTLNILAGPPKRQRVMLSPLAHPSEKRKVFEEVIAFLESNNFNFEVDDQHPKSRMSQP